MRVILYLLLGLLAAFSTFTVFCIIRVGSWLSDLEGLGEFILNPSEDIPEELE